MHRLVIVSLSGGCRTSPCSGIGWRGDLHCVCFHGQDVGAGRVWKAMDAFCMEEMLTKSRTVGLLLGAHGRRGPRRRMHWPWNAVPPSQGQHGGIQAAERQPGLGERGTCTSGGGCARWEVDVHTSVPWDIHHANRSYSKGTLRIPDWSRAGDAFPTVSAVPQSSTWGCKRTPAHF